jgi:hypothetical protein
MESASPRQSIVASSYPRLLETTETRLQLPSHTLEALLKRIASRLLSHDWSWVYHAIGAGQDTAKPYLRASGVRGYQDGRIGIDLHSPWRPGLFAGVLANPRDHRTPPTDAALGADFCIIVSVGRKIDESGINGDTFMAAAEFTALRQRLGHAAPGWEFHDHLTAQRPNRWHPLHLRRPLVDVLEGISLGDETAVYERVLEVTHEGLNLLLEGGELRALRERLYVTEANPVM